MREIERQKMDSEEGDEIRDSRDRKQIRKAKNRRRRKIDRGKEKIVRENDRTRVRRGFRRDKESDIDRKTEKKLGRGR